MRARSFSTMLVATALLFVGCKDPVHDDLVDSLGGEAPNVPKGPYHRPGQPCLVCHGGQGPGGDTFAVAGTVYKYADSDAVLPNALVTLLGADGSSKQLLTNCAGNFYVEAADYAPAWPLLATVDFSGVPQEPMVTGIGRDGSCGGCHVPAAGQSSAGRVYMSEDDTVDFGATETCR